MTLYFFIGFGCTEKNTCSLLMTISYADYTVGIDVISVEILLNFIRNIRKTIKTFTTANLLTQQSAYHFRQNLYKQMF
jgi:hypothetical protein